MGLNTEEKRFRTQLLLCGCCGVYFNTWPEYEDQDQDQGYGICNSCQDWQQEKHQAMIERAYKTIIDGVKPETRAKIEAKHGATYEDRAILVGLAIGRGWLKWGINKS